MAGCQEKLPYAVEGNDACTMGFYHHVHVTSGKAKAIIMAVMGSYSRVFLDQLTSQLKCPIHNVL